MANGMCDFLSRYSNSDLEVLVKVLRDVMGSRKVGVRIVFGE
jgi:glutamate synthase domain-containing protein 2